MFSDFNECDVSRPCSNGECINHLGGYKCLCSPGFDWNEDLKECIGKCTGLSYIAMLNNGAFHTGSCIKLVTPSTDANECEDGTHRCQGGEVCVNTRGAYTCVCPRGFRSEGPGRPCVGE